MINQFCPSCAEKICPPSGNNPDVLIVGEFPSGEEMKQGRPFASNAMFMRAGKIFKKELERVGLSLSDFRVTNLWLHEPTDNENCYNAGYEHALDEAKGKKAILLVGSDVVETFTSYKVSDVNGLQVDSSTLSAPIIYAMFNPSLALHRSVGEVRLSIQKWAKRLEMEGLV